MLKPKKSSLIKVTVLSLLVSLFFPLVPAQAIGNFSPNFIISDAQMTDYQSMGLAAIQKFLEERGSFLVSFITEYIDGGKRTAAEIIFLAANNYKINPKFLLTTIQKEQSLVEDATPTQYQLDWAAGYGRCDDQNACSSDNPAVQKFKGFAKQLDYAAGSMRFFLENPDKSRFKVGQKAVIDGQDVTPSTQATAGMYSYTPHLHGNQNFWNLWSKWFSLFYPDGTLLRDKVSRETWLIQDGLRRKISRSALVSRFDTNKIIPVDQQVIQTYDEGRPIKYGQYSLLKTKEGKTYLLVDDQLRLIASNKVFQSIGFSPDEVVTVKTDDLKDYSTGPEITTKTIYPTGSLLQDKKNGGIFYVENGIKYPLWARELLKTNFASYRNIIKVLPEKLDEFATGEPVRFKDGQLLRSLTTSTVYVVANGSKHPIASEKAFNSLGYKWENVISTNDKALSLHPDAQIIN